ncbi:MAG: dUTP diphosphatase [Weeping tea tree witches'-broom phytoplasma]|uniref:dUTP diphosphatase n=1 Tax=Candidatus Phytoplasma melaleucae TaxID=2982630 RepID=UPI00293B69F8|nr:dUTP diphosphatase [Weeping tea tree witches'-broom phytoplasma]
MNQKNIFFEIINIYKNKNINLPQRQTCFSAGYDFAAAEDKGIKPYQIVLIPTGIKAFFPKNKVLLIYARSSLSIKKKLMLANHVGVIDSDYYNNIQNEGHILIPLYNFSNETSYIFKNERIAQGIFQNFYLTDNDQVVHNKKRINGFGSTSQK